MKIKAGKRGVLARFRQAGDQLVCRSDNGQKSPRQRGLRQFAFALAMMIALSQGGCILVVAGLLSGPIAVGGAITGATIGTQTAYYNLQDFYDAYEANADTVELTETVAGLRIIDSNRNSYRALEKTLSPHGLSPESYLVLAELVRVRGQRIQELKKNIGVNGFPLIESIKDLEERALVEQKQVRHATSYVFVGATEAGEAALERARPSLEHLRFEYLRRLSLDDRRMLTTLVAKAVGEENSPAAGTTGGVLGLTTGGEAEYLLSKQLITTQWLLKRKLERYGITDGEFQVISTLWLGKEVGPRTLSAVTQLRREELRELVSGLSVQNYIVQNAQVTEEGPYTLALGIKGEQLTEQLKPEIDSIDKVLFARLSEDERNTLAQLLTKMSRGIVG